MSVLLGILFAAFGMLALNALLECWRQFMPRVAGLRDALRQPAATDEIRLTLREHVLTSAQRNGSLPRHMRRPKPIRHRLTGRTPRRAIA